MKGPYPIVAPLCAAALLLISVCALAASPFPVQMELRVPFEPTSFPSRGQTFLMYELYLTNLSGSPIDLHRVEVLDAEGSARLAAFEGEQIDALLRPSAVQASTHASDSRRVNAAETLVLFMQVTFDANASVPKRLRHRIVTADASMEGAVIDTRHTELKVLAPPLRGGTWHAYDGPSNDRDNHHRRGLFVVDGRASISRRFATDWFLLKDGSHYKGDQRDRQAHHAYGQPVFAVANGTVVTARDGRPDNVPGPVETFKPALPNTLDTVTGNMIVIDLGGGVFASYFHLQPGSLRVKTGDHVRSGELLARIGVSGDSNMPHLHFELTTSPETLRGEGVPYVFDRYRVKMPDDSWRTVTRELPMRNELVEFGSRGDEVMK